MLEVVLMDCRVPETFFIFRISLILIDDKKILLLSLYFSDVV